MAIDSGSFEDIAPEFRVPHRPTRRLQEICPIVNPVANEECENIEGKVRKVFGGKRMSGIEDSRSDGLGLRSGE